ncbi:hypothetical protein [Isosphaera pallida]|nr:hypothetical protein [Isosphaera pallida]
MMILTHAIEATGGDPRFWKTEQASAWRTTRLEGVVATAEGSVRLAPRIRRMSAPEEGPIWALAVGGDGRVFAATGSAGRVFVHPPVSVAGPLPENGWTETVETGDLQALDLAVGPDGTVWVGTGPHGKVVEVTARPPRTELIAPPVSYVWGLAFDKAGTLWAATGPEGGLYRRVADPLPEKAVWEKVAALPRRHLLSIIADPAGGVVVGTDGAGVVARLAPGESTFEILHQASRTEIHALSFGPDGQLYAGTAGVEGGPTSSAASSPPNTNTADLNAATNVVVQLDPQGRSAARERLKGSFLVHALIQHGQGEDAALLVGLRPEGRLLELRPRTIGDSATTSEPDPASATLLARFDREAVTALTHAGEGAVLVAAGDPPLMALLTPHHRQTGRIESGVFDAKLPARLGRVELDAVQPEGTEIAVEVRVGRTAEPDATWTAWSDPATFAQATTAPWRFLQWRLTLATRDPSQTPQIHSVTVSYQTLNQPPALESLDHPRRVGGINPGSLELKWKASDPNDDPLRFRVFLVREGDPDSDAVELTRRDAPLNEPKFTWDPATVASGRYRFRVTADDRAANPAAEAFETVLVGPPLMIDFDAPLVQPQAQDTNRDALRIVVRDASSRIVGVEAALDGGPWQPLFPTTGLYDRKTIEVVLPLDPHAPPRWVRLRAKDEAGNLGFADWRSNH